MKPTGQVRPSISSNLGFLPPPFAGRVGDSSSASFATLMGRGETGPSAPFVSIEAPTTVVIGPPWSCVPTARGPLVPNAIKRPSHTPFCTTRGPVNPAPNGPKEVRPLRAYPPSLVAPRPITVIGLTGAQARFAGAKISCVGLIEPTPVLGDKGETGLDSVIEP